MSQATIVYANQNDTIDAMCWRHYGSTQGVLELVLQANPQLAEQGALLPMGTPVTMPPAPESATVEALQLWD